MTITELLKKYGYIDTSFYTEGSAEYGSMIHQQTENFDNEKIYINDLRVKQYIEWQKIYKPGIISIEERLFYKTISGKPDRIISINDKLAIIDIKTSKSYQKWWDIQVSAYIDLALKNNYKVCSGYVLQLLEEKFIFTEINYLYGSNEWNKIKEKEGL